MPLTVSTSTHTDRYRHLRVGHNLDAASLQGPPTYDAGDGTDVAARGWRYSLVRPPSCISLSSNSALTAGYIGSDEPSEPAV
jgi:hypothetical protein